MDHQGQSTSSPESPPSSSLNPPPPPSSSSRPPAGGASNVRAQTATQRVKACDRCRRRKVKCDEERPKCGNCAKGDFECEYRETQPTKKDKTATDTLEIVKRLEVLLLDIKAGQESDSGRIRSTTLTQDSPTTLQQYSTVEPLTRGTSVATSPRQRRPSRHLGQTAEGISQPYLHATAAHKLLTWPAIRKLLENTGASNAADLQSLSVEGSAFIIRVCQGMPGLPLDEGLFQKPFLGMQEQATRAARFEFPDLKDPPDKMDRLADAYFDTYNLLYPFMDRATFMSDTLNKVKSQGFDSDTVSVGALLVFALGEVAEDSRQAPLSQSQFGQGRRDHSSDGRYPGIGLFNEARKRIGFVMTECTLENVQVLSLAALYYESCSCYVDFWRMTVWASAACEVLVTCKRIPWNSSYGDLVRRAYWHCGIFETGLHLELDLPLTGLLKHQDEVGSVAFLHLSCEKDYVADQRSHFRQHYSSQLALRRLCAELHDRINESMGTAIVHGSTSEGFNGPTVETLNDLGLELPRWRSLLPAELQWPEDDPTAYPAVVDQGFVRYQQNMVNVDPALAGSKLFSIPSSQRIQPVLPYVYDIQVALLRTRYYYAKYMVYRPYIYKALHFPEQINAKDVEPIANCLKACLKWPITMAPTCHRKRLIPYLFCWSQNFLGIIMILHLSKVNPVLWNIRENCCGGLGSQFEQDVEESIELMIAWIVDLKDMCPVARWCLSVLKPLLHLDEEL